MSPRFNEWPMPTFGAGAVWEEVAQVGEFRIQRNRVTGHHRLLDSANVRRAWGNLETCEDVLGRLIAAPDEPTNPNLPLPTLGGLQFWADEMIRCGWRIQRSVFTGHCRLLDSADRRQAWGTFAQCEVAMRRLQEAAGLEPAGERAAVLIHGILGWKDRWAPMSDALRRRGLEVIDVNYPSTRARIEDHVAQLRTVLANMDEFEEINFVTHSMGGLILRRLLADWPDLPARRAVLIAPPNRGAVTADLVREFFAYRLVFGPAGQQLVTGVASFTHGLPPPRCEFGVIAGGRGDDVGFNPLIAGDDDGVVPVESTRLEGMSDFLLVPRLHSAIIRAPEVVAATVRFLETGRFR